MKLSYFPEIYPNELLYSIVARYGSHTGISATTRLNEILFDNPTGNFSTDMPSNVGYLASVVPEIRSLNSRLLIERHTLYNFLCAFSDSDYREKVMVALTTNQSTGHRAAVRRTSLLGTPDRLRFCPDCRSEMIKDYGEAYWRRDHQIPLVLVCPNHGRILCESLVVSGRDASEYVTLNECMPTNREAIEKSKVTPQLVDHLTRLAALCFRYTNTLSSLDHPAVIAERNRCSLEKAGFSISKNYLDNERIRFKLNNYLQPIVPLWPRLQVNGLIARSWAMLPLKSIRSNAHPAYHVIMEDFISQHASEANKNDRAEFWRLERDDWPCFNPIFSHPNQPKVRIRKSYKFTDYSSAQFSCECGYTYTRKRFSDGSFSEPTVRSFGPTLVPLLSEATKNGWSARHIGVIVGMKGSSVKKQAEMLGIQLVPGRGGRPKGS